jgi:hypothetical protein
VATTAWGLDSKDVIQVDATVIVGVLILLSLNIYIPQSKVSVSSVSVPQIILTSGNILNCSQTHNTEMPKIIGTIKCILEYLSKSNSTLGAPQSSSKNIGQKQIGLNQAQTSVSTTLTAVAVIPFIISAIIAAIESKDNAGYGTGALIGSFGILVIVILYITFFSGIISR